MIPDPKDRSDSELGGDTAGKDQMNPGRKLTKEEIDEERLKNPDTSKPVDGAERDGGGGGTG